MSNSTFHFPIFAYFHRIYYANLHHVLGPIKRSTLLRIRFVTPFDTTHGSSDFHRVEVRLLLICMKISVLGYGWFSGGFCVVPYCWQSALLCPVVPLGWLVSGKFWSLNFGHALELRRKGWEVNPLLLTAAALEFSFRSVVLVFLGSFLYYFSPFLNHNRSFRFESSVIYGQIVLVLSPGSMCFETLTGWSRDGSPPPSI